MTLTFFYGPGHEYARKNIRFAAFIDPDNENVRVCFNKNLITIQVIQVF